MYNYTVFCSYIGQICVYNSNSILKVQVCIHMQPTSPAEDKSTLLIVIPTNSCLVLYLLAPLGVAMFKLWLEGSHQFQPSEISSGFKSCTVQLCFSRWPRGAQSQKA